MSPLGNLYWVRARHLSCRTNIKGKTWRLSIPHYVSHKNVLSPPLSTLFEVIIFGLVHRLGPKVLGASFMSSSSLEGIDTFIPGK